MSERPHCPICNGQKVYKNGSNTRDGKAVQRWFCQDCRKTFSE